MADFHIHTTKSDGVHTPLEILQTAKELKLQHIAITDHHTLAGYDEIRDIWGDYVQNVVPGFETSACDRRNLHILGYGMSDCDRMQHELAPLRHDRHERVVAVLDGLCGKGVNIPDDIRDYILQSDNTDLLWVAKQISHFGYRFDYEEGKRAVYNTLKDLEIEYIKKAEKPSARKLIKLIKDCGGVSVLAHPKWIKTTNKNENGRHSKISRVDFENLFHHMVDAGLDGIESLNQRHDMIELDYYTSLANNAGLFNLGGSDYHGRCDEQGNFWGSKHIGNPYVNQNDVDKFYAAIDDANYRARSI